MGRISLISLVVLLYCSSALSQSINEIISKYDHQLSTKQRNYRLWLEAENDKAADVFKPLSVENLSSINDNIDYLISAQDTVRLYLLFFLNKSSEYGDKLSTLIKEAEEKEKFYDKWRTYQEGMAEVMNYDLEKINLFLEALIFLRDNYSEYEVEDDFIQFYKDASLNEYKKLLSAFFDPKIQVNQQKVRSNTGHIFLEAINIVKEAVKE